MNKQKLDLTTLKIDELINFTGAMIQFDNIELISSAKEITAKYQNLVVTEEIIPSIKKEVADLNKLVKQMEDQRKSIKNTYNEPYNAFETKIKEVTTIISGTVDGLKIQLDVFEKKRKQEKMEVVSKLIASIVFEAKLLPKYARQVIVHDKFLNASESLSQITLAINDQIKHLLEAQNNELQAERLRLEMETMKQAEQERKQAELQAKTVARMELLNHLKNKYNILTVTYSDTKHLTDIELHKFFEDIKFKEEAKIEAEKQEQIKTELSKICDNELAIENEVMELINTITYKENPAELCTNSFSIIIEGITHDELDEIIAGIKEYYPHSQIKNI